MAKSKQSKTPPAPEAEPVDERIAEAERAADDAAEAVAEMVPDVPPGPSLVKLSLRLHGDQATVTRVRVDGVLMQAPAWSLGILADVELTDTAIGKRYKLVEVEDG